MDSVKRMIKHQISIVEKMLEGQNKKMEGQNKLMGNVMELLLHQHPKLGVTHLSGGPGPVNASEIQLQGGIQM
jgi:hypothetical protein